MTTQPTAPIDRAPAEAPSPSPSPSPDAAAATAVGGATILVIVLLAMNLRTVIASLPPLLAAVRADLGLSAGVAGLLTTLPVLCFGALAPVVPRLARRVALEHILVACAAVTAVAAGLRGVGTTAALFAGSLLAGAAVGIAQASLPVLIRTRFAAVTGRLTGAYSTALPLGATVAGVSSVPLEHALGHSWQASLAFWALPAAALAAWAPAALRGRTLVRGAAPPPMLGEPLAWAVALLFGVQSVAFYAGLAWLPEILQSHGTSAAAAGALQGLCNLASMAPAFAVPVVAVRLRSQVPVLLAVVGVAAAGVSGLLVAPGAAAVWVVLLGLGQGGILGLALILPVLRAGGTGAVAALTAMTLCVGYLIGAAGPGLLGLAHDLSGGWRVPLAVLLAMTLLELVPGLPASRRRTVG